MQDWTKNWEALQRQFMGAMSELGGAPKPEFANPWQNLSQPFAAAFAPPPAAPNEVLDRLTAGAKGYFALLQSLAGSAGNLGNTGGASAWTDALRKGFNIPGMDPSLLDNPLAQAMRDMSGQGAKGFDTMMGEFAKAAAPFRQQFATEMGVPAFGLGREQQERWQTLAAAMADHQQQNNRYQALILGSSRAAFDRFQSKLAEREEPGRQLESVRQVYDLWIDAAEEAYAEVALSPEFREAYGAMVNSQMRVRSLVQGEVERMAGQLGMPTRTEVRSLEKAVHELRRAMKKAPVAAAASAKNEKTPAQFKAEIDALRAELADAKKPPAAQKPAHDPRPSKAAVSKKRATASAPKPRASVSAPPSRNTPSTPRRKR